jgi:AcrR family transcriptional regulator
MPGAASKSEKPQACRDAEATKARILDAAEFEFAQAGLLGARTEAIAGKTGVTKAMLYYYFGDKEGLYLAVLERAYSRRMAALQKVDLHALDPEQGLRAFLAAFLEEVGVNRNLAPIFFYEGIQNQGRFYSKIAMQSLYMPLVELLQRGMEQGKFRQMDTFHVAVNVIGMCTFYFCSMENIKHLWAPGTDLLSEEMRNSHKQEAIEQAVASVLAR